LSRKVEKTGFLCYNDYITPKGGARMTNIEKMKSYLREYVFPQLYEKGFTGKWPHFRRERDDCIELISLETRKWGGAFYVHVSAIFPNSENKNYTVYEWMDITEDQIAAWDTNLGYSLKGMYEEAFFYHDLYSEYIIGIGKIYHTVSEKKASEFVPPKRYKLVKKFNDEAALEICNEVNKQMAKAFKWLCKFEKKHQKKYDKSKGGTKL
jgi:hypothetical protein